ncbi:hypothetical protein P0D75_30670 [Paraburkholderia sediminicola]|uniref:hypothetical protein n=1 Tax=Paraburkholderia sediminicola TaxID=458836 RepID=UPI0038BD86C6
MTGLACMYKFFLKIPVVGSIVYITNTYALRGDPVALEKLANPVQWIKVFFFPWMWAALLTGITAPSLAVHVLNLSKLLSFPATVLELKAGEFITTVFPNLLGFGIGVYALIFAISDKFLSRFEDHVTRKKHDGSRKFGSALVFNVDLAYPLLVIVMTLIVGVLQQAYPTTPAFCLFAWFSFWYAIITMIEIVAVLFGLGEHTLLEKIDSPDSPKKGPPPDAT